MDASYITAFAALGGAALGGMTSFATSWANLRTQMKEQHRNNSRSRRRELYKAFIDEASKTYGDALIHDKPELTGLIDLHSLVSRMRILSSAEVIENAVAVVRVITDTYGQPNRGPLEIEAMIQNGQVDLLNAFSEACRQEFERNLAIQ